MDRQAKIKFCCAIAASIIWLVTAGFIIRNIIVGRGIAWVPFEGFTALMVALVLPTLLTGRNPDA
jgi:hypothetical protein